MSENYEKGFDLDDDGKVTDEEFEKVRKFARFENQDKKEDAQRKMAWFALIGMLLYPFAVVLAVWLSLDGAAGILGDMASAYFLSVTGIVAAFYGKEAFESRYRRNDDDMID